MRGRLAALWLTGVMVFTTGCGARTEYYVAHLDLARESWDTLRVAVGFARRTTVGGDHPIEPEQITISVFDAAYRTLYTGPERLVPIPDARLGDRERLLVEVCGVVGGREICMQEQQWASPKRIEVDHAITYPDGDDFDRGRYDLAFRVERRRFENDGWERLEDVEGVSGYLLARLDGEEKGIVRIPFTRRTGRFDLSRLDNYRDFRYYLDAQLLDHRQARVRFDVYAGLRGAVSHVASVEKEVVLKTDDERREEVRFFAEQATERLVDALSTFLGARRTVAYVDDWEYLPVSRTYRVDMEVRWRARFGGEHFDVLGTLEVGEDGSNARFRLRSGNEEARRRWERRVEGEVLALGRFDLPEEPPDPPAPDPRDAR